MVNANEWLNRVISTSKKREQATTLSVYRGDRVGVCWRSYRDAPVEYFDGNQNNCLIAPNYCFYNVGLEGELDLNDFVSLQELRIEGTAQQQQKLTSLKIDKCIVLTKITINYTTLGSLSLGSKPRLQQTNFVGNKRLIFRDIALKDQIETLTSLILPAKSVSLNDLKLVDKKIKEERLDYHLQVIKSSFDENNQLWLESLVDAQQEVLKNNSKFARKQLEKCKKKLLEALTAEEIQDILNKKIEINELEVQLNNLNKFLLRDRH
ncbi:5106_t:CDS:1 [Racocetra fulgida]|uniref:5106_t:CDS:1 n=1 Tax=Racocetra fulgida TaxID=60492 RepID=A0A9N8YUE3_9GLOM|nr:5106_t:CDS:1 [Racocetra fulgida]